MALSVLSSAIPHDGKIPILYTCDSENVHPPLTISHLPESTKSLVILMDDPDIPDSVKELMGIQVFDHWVLYNIPPAEIINIVEGKPVPGVEGTNTAGNPGYTGPCPPDREHRYFFKVYALDAMLELPEGATKAEVEEAMEGHIIESAELIGRYERVR